MTFSKEPPRGRLAAKLFSARVSLLAESFVACFWPALLWFGVFLTAVLLGADFPFLSPIFWLGFTALFIRGCIKFKAPAELEIKRRLEQDSLVRHRPLRSQDDQLTGQTSETGNTLWSFERERKKSLLGLLRWVKPRFGLVRRDPYALRIALILLLVTAAVAAGATAPDKLNRLLVPFSLQVNNEESAPFKILIMPPSYTQKPYLLIAGRPKDPVPVPQGSTIKVTAQSWAGHLTLQLGDLDVPLSREGKTDVYTAAGTIPESDSIKITQFGLPRLSIPITYIADKAPEISLRDKPLVLLDGQLRLPLTVTDDYGLKLIRLRAIFTPQVRDHPLGEPVFEEQSIIVATAGKPVDINPTFDLTGHPWAGYPVSLLIEAEDHAGQDAQAEPVELTLPERNFRHPVARTIAAIRKMIIRRGEMANDAGMMALAGLLTKPQNYDWDPVVTLALRSAAGRLSYESGRTGSIGAINILWPTALRLEDGNLTTGQADVRKALQALQKAMQEKASPEEIAQKMQEFRDALANYLAAMQKEIEKKIAQGEITPLSPDMMMQTLDSSMLNDFLSQLENEMINGDAEAAMKKLENLQKLTDMLNPSMAQALPEDVKKDMQNLKDLQKVIDQQQELLDKTRSLADKKTETAQEKAQQDAIGNSLKKIQQPGGKAQAPLEKAGTSMGQSSEKLGQNMPGGAIPHEQDALDALREGRKQMQESLKQKMQGMTGMSMGSAPRPYDPLGRGKPENGRNMFDEKVEIPSGAQRKKADEILKVIRERSGDLNRPLNEREYYQRLLRQW